jgi:hypothetical protein
MARAFGVPAKQGAAQQAALQARQQTGGAQAAPQAGPQAGGAQAGPQAGPQAAPQYNKYNEQLADMKRNSAFGVFIPDLLKAKSGGREDMQRNIKLLIRKQYFSTYQVFRLLVTFLVLGMMVATALYSALWSPLATREYYQCFAFGVCAGAFVGMFYWYMVGANWETVCNKHSPGVDPDKRGTECISADDCTVGRPSVDNMCVHRRPSDEVRIVRNSLMFFLLVGAGIFAGAASTAGKWDVKHAFAGVVFGASCGMFVWQIFPLEKK